MVKWITLCWNGGDCDGHDPYLPEETKILIIIAHLLGYPVILYGFYVMTNRVADIRRVGANYEFLFVGFVSLVVQTDFFIADHINSMWIAKPQFSILAHIGYSVIVSSNCLLALGFIGYSFGSIFCCGNVEQKDEHQASLMSRLSPSNSVSSPPRMTLKRAWSKIAPAMSALFALAQVAVTVYAYNLCKTVAVAMTAVSGIWCVNSLKYKLGQGIYIYITIGITAVAVGGTLTAVMNAICVQWLHMIIATSFSVQALGIALSLKNFKIVGGEQNFLRVNNSI